ncbi:MAG: hypothetical protein C4551_09920 [Bacillota bacterium]|nr:MAG: hypothetical protein C4551_09920 [Bacillota bacterium]
MATSAENAGTAGPGGRRGEDYVLVLGQAAMTALRVTRDGLEPAGAVAPTGGRVPSPARVAEDLALEGDPVFILAGAGSPRVTVDGRYALNPAGIKATAATVLRTGAVPAGPLPSETAAADVFVHELARQRPDVLLLTQTMAGDKLRSLARFLETPSFLECPLPIVYSGRDTLAPKTLENLPGCRYEPAPVTATSGKVDTRTLERLLTGLVQDLTDAAVSRAGFGRPPAMTMGRAAVAAAVGLIRLAGPGGACLIAAEPAEVAAFVPAADTIDAASTSVTGTGTVELCATGRGGAGGPRPAGWMPAWEDLINRIPLHSEAGNVANKVADVLVRPWAGPAGPEEACVAAALIEDVLCRLIARWDSTVRPETNPRHCRVIVGTGLGFWRLGDPRLAAACLLDALQPVGVTTVGIDPWGRMLVEAAVNVPRPLGPDWVATCVSPLRARLEPRNGDSDPWAIVTVLRSTGQTTARRLVPGRIGSIHVPPGEKAELTIEPCLRHIDFGAGPGKTWRGRVNGSLAGVILDGRGRPLETPADPVLRVTKQREFLAALGVLGELEGRARKVARRSPGAARGPRGGSQD